MCFRIKWQPEFPGPQSQRSAGGGAHFIERGCSLLSRDDLRFGDKLRPVDEMPECGLELSGGERWFVAQTLHHREKLAALHLGAQRFRSFLPRFRKTVRHARQIREV